MNASDLLHSAQSGLAVHLFTVSGTRSARSFSTSGGKYPTIPTRSPLANCMRAMELVVASGR